MIPKEKGNNKMTTVNEKEKEMLHHILAHPMFSMIMDEKYEKQLDSLRNKISKKKIDKHAKIDSLSLIDYRNQEFTFELAKENGSLLVIATKESERLAVDFYFKWSSEQLIEMVNYFYKLLLFWGEELQMPYHKGYSEEFNVYEKEIERTFSVGPSTFYFICYTNNSKDDNWTRIRPSRMREVVRMMIGYIFLDEKNQDLIPTLDSDIQKIYPKWKELLDNNELITG